MSGLYIHIPFCKQACSYCDFHFTTSMRFKDEVLEAICKELVMARDFIDNKKLQTIYVGGGTPSLLSAAELGRLFRTIDKYYDISGLQECTMEANPDDLTQSYLRTLKKETVIDRLSIGIQSFQKEDLQLMNRAHNAYQAEACIKDAQDAGFENLSCDLIFGTPTLSDGDLSRNIDMLARNAVPHISAYALTIEKNTALYKKVLQQAFMPASDIHYERQMLTVMHQLPAHGYAQYEISNYARDGYIARHNTSYWRQVPYFGIGPSAHAFNGKVRRWNVRNNRQYMEALLRDNRIPYEEEVLTPYDVMNEYIMTSLRTMWGLDTVLFAEKFGESYYLQLLQMAQPLLHNRLLTESDHKWTLSLEARIISDTVMSDLFFV